MKTRLEDAAIATLKRRRVLNRSCRLAQAHLKKCQFWANRSYNPKWKYRLDEAKEDLRRKIRESEEEEMKLGLSDIETRRFGERLRLSHKLFKRFKKVPDKKSKSSTTASSIKLGDWLVGDSGPNLIPPLQPDLDCPPLLSPPTLEEVRSILDQMKNGKTPGADNLCSEYLKYGGEQALGELHQLLTKVWIENCMPADWKHVVVVPIPKVKNPKTTDHYRKGVPNNFINRVIECLKGEQQFLWQRQLSETQTRHRGIKQGCPLSPFIFLLIMEAVLESVADEIPNLHLNPDSELELPLILAFADDLIIVADSVSDVETILSSLKENLSYVGLNLNQEKCKVLIREPKGEAVTEISILGKTYKTTEPLRYLGIYITPRLDRPMTTRTRCRNAVKSSRIVMDFLNRYNPPWDIGRAFYETVIAPSMIYGTQTAVLTKYSRRSIRGYEQQIVHALYNLCRGHDSSRPPPPVNVLLKKRRITKKIRMYQMRWWGHVMRRPRSHILRIAARLRPARLRACRPGLTWRDSVRQTMDRYNGMTHRRWKELSRDKDNFHKKLLEIYDAEESDKSDW
ncbi:hypothetical protein pipiens_018401, partial [Culex pipiens pipiens]